MATNTNKHSNKNRAGDDGSSRGSSDVADSCACACADATAILDVHLFSTGAGADILMKIGPLSDVELEENFIVSSIKTSSSFSDQKTLKYVIKGDKKFDEKNLRKIAYTLLRALSFLSQKGIAVGYLRPSDVLYLEHSIYALGLSGEKCVFRTPATSMSNIGNRQSVVITEREETKFLFYPELGKEVVLENETVTFQEFRAPEQITSTLANEEKSSVWHLGLLLLSLLSGFSHNDFMDLSSAPVSYTNSKSTAAATTTAVAAGNPKSAVVKELYIMAYMSRSDIGVKVEYENLLHSLLARRNILISQDFSALIVSMLNGDPSLRPSLNKCLEGVLCCKDSSSLGFTTKDIKKVHDRKRFDAYAAELSKKKTSRRQSTSITAAENSIAKRQNSVFGFSWLKDMWTSFVSGCSCEVEIDPADFDSSSQTFDR